MIDPLRPEAKSAVASSRAAGISVAMVTGDHPTTALAIARELDLAHEQGQVVTDHQLKKAAQEGVEAVATLTSRARVFARVEPQQKLDIVQSLQHQGNFVAVTGDGANDAPALRVAQVGVAMGDSGTDVARETADLIVTDDDFASIVASIEEARNGTLLLMVLFENVHVFNSRSETLSAFRHNPLRNRLLLFGTLIAQLVHIGAMYTPGLCDVLQVQPVSFEMWLKLLGVALSILVVMEAHKLVRHWLANSRGASARIPYHA